MISVIIPAHNEAAVIERTLSSITGGAIDGELEIIVVCNACSDSTAEIARKFGPAVRVVETDKRGKANALNLGDRNAHAFPRVYLDADISVSVESVRMLIAHVEKDGVLAVAPTARNDVSGCSRAVKAFYRVFDRLPFAREGIGCSGVYVLSEAGRRRFSEFPDLISDDGFVRLQFTPHERATLPFVRSQVFAPRTARALIAIKARAHLGTYQLAQLHPDLAANTGESNSKQLPRLFLQPLLWPGLAVYCVITMIARVMAKRRLNRANFAWDRDSTSRSSAQVMEGAS